MLVLILHEKKSWQLGLEVFYIQLVSDIPARSLVLNCDVIVSYLLWPSTPHHTQTHTQYSTRLTSYNCLVKYKIPIDL